jgi:ABC-2 type transport system permease protein
MQLVRDTAVVSGYELRRAVSNPVWVLIGMLQPAMWLLLFVPLLSEMSPMADQEENLAVFVPGVLTMLALLSTLLAGFSFLSLMRTGVLERLLVTRANRLSLALGRITADVAGLVAQSVLLLVLATIMGFRVSFLGILLMLMVMFLLGLTVASLSYALALTIRDERSFSSVINFGTLPLMLMSGVLIPLSFAPAWMQMAGQANPIRYAVDAIRALAVGDYASTEVFAGFAVLAAVTAAALTWAARSYRRVVV